MSRRRSYPFRNLGCQRERAAPVGGRHAGRPAGLDGVQNKIEPPAPIDKDLYDLEPEEAVGVQSVPGSLAEVLDALEADHEYLLRGGVFTKDLVETYIEYKREREVDAVNLRPHPYEFHLYYDI